MPQRLTLLKAKEYLASKAPADELNYRLNRVVEHYLLDGKFVGSMLRLALACQFGQVALPQEFHTLEGARVATQTFGEQGRVFDLGNRWWRYLPGKGHAYDGAGYGGGYGGYAGNLDVIEDFGDMEAVMSVPYLLPKQNPPANDYRFPFVGSNPRYDFPEGLGTFQATYAGVTNYPVTMYGRDTDENPIVLTLPDQAAYTNPFARIERIHTGQIPVTMNIKYTLPSPDSRVLVVAIIDGVQEEAVFRRYFIPLLVQQPNAAIDAFVKRRHLEFTSDQDVLPIANVSALGLGLDAYALEANNDMTGALQFWNAGVALLNAELGDMHAADEIPAIRFHYPGRTRPQLTTHF